MPPAASGMSSSYLPRRGGSPVAGATAGTLGSFHSLRNLSISEGLGGGARERHVGYAERRCHGRATHLEIVGYQVDPLENLVEVRGDRDLANWKCELSILDPEALRASREISRNGIEAKSHQRCDVKPLRCLLEQLRTRDRPGAHQ